MRWFHCKTSLNNRTQQLLNLVGYPSHYHFLACLTHLYTAATGVFRGHEL